MRLWSLPRLRCPLPARAFPRFWSRAMASILKHPLDPAAVAAALGTADVELLFLFDSGKIPKDVQAKIVGLGYSDPEVFAKLEDTAEAARGVFKSDLDLDDG